MNGWAGSKCSVMFVNFINQCITIDTSYFVHCVILIILLTENSA